ncbi:BadF/BadG/BcrA/BcrD ATPase family protein [Fundidesulfovibrio terrae]|uniref:BadF/BadG/BcrA/BcrD ATPase family protein n=1 Tax=Fundidesulfovibrio terrae TaxID=2922866 RepID=UPI001FAFE296|nr:BadF/BadG/BcrA/BcrD ATPase family protein [Fundidesulfovibrio terrae]
MRPDSTDALGLCLGASSIGLVRLSRSPGEPRVVRARSRAHGGDPVRTLLELLEAEPGWRSLPVAATGRRLRELTRLPSLSEPEAVELAARFVLPENTRAATVVSAGGETFMAYRLDASGRVREIQSGNKCASGTGEFLLQQLSRMGLGLSDLAAMDHGAEPHAVSGRCSVFCKSDCTHALNKGASRPSVAAGLGRMMASKCLELIQSMPRDTVLLTGGCAANPYLARFLRQEIAGLVVPESAPWFEALGAALWALDNAPPPPGEGSVLTGRAHGFNMLPPISGSLGMVEFKESHRARAHAGDEVIVGLDVGSTTTKGVVLRRLDRAVLAGEYLRTEGDPIGASRRVYASLSAQLPARVRVEGLGVTGSGRAIAALHAQATAAINEIVAHAAAAAHYDPEVDTIFEIGGQDAKYTFLWRGHPCDSAMNEACSAGTGSFLEESARETLGVDTRDIADLALSASATPNFNDQCAAFIGSDIKAAVQEGVPLPDILAGLVHSVCLNYVSRVKGSRPVGERVFMQGGVCYNRAVPAAMAMLTGKRVVVPPDPGLMGALGVALEVDSRMRRGELPEGDFDLDGLSAREAGQREPFTCRGGKGGPGGRAGCDRGCVVARIEVAGKVHPFGGICNRFENLRQGRARKLRDAGQLDLVQARSRRVFRDHDPAPSGLRPVVGLSRSYLVNTYYPLFSAFLKELGFDVALGDKADPEGMRRMGSALCHPGELAHGFMADLLAKRPDAVFLPHIRGVPAPGGQGASCTCVLLQGEPFALRAAFPELAAYGPRLLTPTLDFTRGLAQAEGAFLQAARSLGADERAARAAFQAGLTAQILCRRDLAQMGREALSRLEDTPDMLGVAVFGRSYNAFAPQANKAVPEKLATRGALAIPCDILPLPPGDLGEPGDRAVYWGQGRAILAGARFAAARPDLFGAYVTNFSCGPDSFLLGYFRDIMGLKPSLTLELDSHTADAGLETRVEAFLDIAASHRRRTAAPLRPSLHRPARMLGRHGQAGIVTSSGEWLPLTHSRVRLALPSMNPYGTAFSAAGLAASGIRGVALPPAGEEALKLGRGNSSCKECLPLQLTVGTLLQHLADRPPEEATAYFMPGAGGPCRFGQYQEFTSRLIARLEIPDAAVLTPSADNGYSGLPGSVTLAIWRGTVAGDFFEEMRAGLAACARDRGEAQEALGAAARRVGEAMGRSWKEALAAMRRESATLARIPLTAKVSELPRVSLLGEIYVRHDPLSRQNLMENLARRGMVVRTSPVSEWVFYTDWLQNEAITERPDMKGRLKQWFKRRVYRQVREATLPSGLVANHEPDVREALRAGSALMSPMLTGEAILTVGAALHDILNPACGVMAIGPFGCMPARLAESVLTKSFTTDTLARIYPWRVRRLPPQARGPLPLVTVETDGNPFPQLIEARLEAFCLQAMRLHEAMRDALPRR